MSKSEGAARLRRAWTLSVIGVVPYALFIVLLSADPASLGARPFGGAISLAIYIGVFLFAWPVIVAIAYVKAKDGATS